MEQSRSQKEAHFYSHCNENMSVLDVGVSSETETGGAPSRNHFLKNFPYDSKNYTGLGVQDLSSMEKLFPKKRFVQYSGGVFPFPDQKFDWVFSNAVIEHVGDDDAQVDFINEMARVASNVFFTTPNKYFPIESHTNVPFLHWNNKIFYMWCKRHRKWVTKNSLYLLSYSRLTTLLEKSNVSTYNIRKNYTLGIPMTFSVTCTKNG